jgi:hypothetical protein
VRSSRAAMDTLRDVFSDADLIPFIIVGV